MSAARDLGERLAWFRRALADNITVHEARARIAQERWAGSMARLRRSQRGTGAPAFPAAPTQPSPQWWQRD